MPMVIQACYECGDEICYEMDDLAAEAYFQKTRMSTEMSMWSRYHPCHVVCAMNSIMKC